MPSLDSTSNEVLEDKDRYSIQYVTWNLCFALRPHVLVSPSFQIIPSYWIEFTAFGGGVYNQMNVFKEQQMTVVMTVFRSMIDPSYPMK